jgi:sugar phosphate isomerase/epimerase
MQIGEPLGRNRVTVPGGGILSPTAAHTAWAAQEVTMEFRFAACTAGMDDVPHAELQRLFSQAGFDAVEIMHSMLTPLTVEQAARLGEEYRAAGVPVETVHLPFEGAAFDIAHFYESRRRPAVARIRHAMERAAAAGAKAGILHPTTSREPVDVNGFERSFTQMAASMRELLREAERVDLMLAVENLPPVPGRRYGSLPDHFRRFAGELAHSHLCFCLDTGHALMAAGHDGTIELMEAMGDRLRAFHLSDTPGDRDLHLAPGHGAVDFPRVFAHARRLDPLAMCIETPPFAPGPAYGDDAWRAMVDEVRALAAPPT